MSDLKHTPDEDQKESTTNVLETEAIEPPTSNARTLAAASLVDWDAEEERKLVSKMDWRIVPFMVLTFMMNYIDRNILTNARLRGLQSDLHLTDIQYATCLSILFAGYVSMQVPSTIFLNKIKWPKYYFMLVITVWGAISACTAAVQGYAGMVIVRFFLGFVEATLYPGALYYLSRFYTRKEIGFRVAMLNIGLTLASGIGSLIAAGVLADLQGVGGIAAWRWLFIIEGVITIGLGLSAPFILINYPAESTAFTPRQKHIALTRLIAERGVTDGTSESTSWAAALEGTKQAASDPVTWLFAISYFLGLDSLGYGVYLPSILATFGFSTTITLVMVFPTSVWQTLVGLGLGWVSDRTGKRWIWLISIYGLTLIGYIIFMVTPSTSIGPRYFSFFLCAFGLQLGIIILPWMTTCTPYPPAKRAAMIGFVNGFANLGQIPSTYYFQTKWAPGYVPSMGIETGVLCLAMIMITITMLFLRRRNRAMDRGDLVMYVDDKTVEATKEIANDGEKEEIIRSTWRYQL